MEIRASNSLTLRRLVRVSCVLLFVIAALSLLEVYNPNTYRLGREGGGPTLLISIQTLVEVNTALDPDWTIGGGPIPMAPAVVIADLAVSALLVLLGLSAWSARNRWGLAAAIGLYGLDTVNSVFFINLDSLVSGFKSVSTVGAHLLVLILLYKGMRAAQQLKQA